MSPDKQQIAIAEACGLKLHTEIIEHTDGYQWIEVREFWVDSKGQRVAVPDYLNDLNAMHEAEQVLTYNSLFTYGEELCWVCAASQHDRVSLVPEVFRATAAQRAEAFIRTLGKWEDSK